MRAIVRTGVGLVLLSVLTVAAGVAVGPAAADVTGNGTVSLTAGGGELATTRLYNESGVVRNP